MSLPPVDSLPAWSVWRSGGPSEPGGWIGLTPAERRGWLHVTATAAVLSLTFGRRFVDRDVTLDGSTIEQLADLLLVLGESINGPGGYYGHSLSTLEQCLMGGHGTNDRFRLRWRHSATARRALTHLVDTPSGPRTEFEYVLTLLKHAHIDVTLE